MIGVKCKKWVTKNMSVVYLCVPRVLLPLSFHTKSLYVTKSYTHDFQISIESMTGIPIPNAICKSFPVSALKSFKLTRSVQRADRNWEGASKYSCRGVDRQGARRGQWYFFTERSPWYSASACDDDTWLASYQMQGHRLTPWIGKLQRHHRPGRFLSARTWSWVRRRSRT